ncbi:MAG: UDP-N-acetylmuramate dehydrogenase [Deltaproteobacteria bacterium]|nr:UDP-N-acetylmuramate dehydrogenase [Deltaproteobacteria bacterium]
MAKTAMDVLQKLVRGRVVLNAPMAELTTMRVGGPADLLVYPADRDDLTALLGVLRERSVPYLVLGAGSNLVVRDGGVRGAAISLAEGFRTVERRDGAQDRITFWADAGVSLRRLIRWTVDEGVSGLEALAGIPGTVGGALAMNAGAWGVEIGERVLEVEIMTPEGDVRRLDRDRLRFTYRQLDLPAGAIVLGALLWGEPCPPEQVKAKVQDLLRLRRDKQPLQEPSAGSVFKNPPSESAGRLIEQCGLKGVKVGEAEVSRIHANFIVNAGMATASQVVALMGMIQERVYVRFKVRLDPEVRIVGDWDKGKLRIQE